MGDALEPAVAVTPVNSGVNPLGSPGEAGPDSTATPVVVVIEVVSLVCELWWAHAARASAVTSDVIRMRRVEQKLGPSS